MDEMRVNICNWCNQPSIIIWVHGHAQCPVYGVNVDECCRGEEADPPTPSRGEGEKDKTEDD